MKLALVPPFLWVLLAGICLGTDSSAHAACGGNLQPMTVGVLPDVFLTPIQSGPVPGLGGGLGSGGAAALLSRVEPKALFHYYTTNPAISPVANCNVDLMSNLRGLLVSSTYSDCPLEVSSQFREPDFNPGRVAACSQRRYPPAITVGPDIGDSGARRWPFQVSLQWVVGSDRMRARIDLIGTNCPGDVCWKSLCLRGGESEFTTGQIPQACLRFDPADVHWSGSPEVGASYLMGQGNLYVGPRVQPAFAVRADREASSLTIDHWISNGNPRAVVLISAIHSPDLPPTYWGTAYDPGLEKWLIVPMDGRSTIPAGANFHVYVMGGDGPGRRLPIHSGALGTRIRLDDPLLNGNPNAVLVVSLEAAQVCRSGSGGGGLSGSQQRGSATIQGCRWEGFNHPVAVRYSPTLRAWEVVSESGAEFRGLALHVLRAGLPGSFQRERWPAGIRPDYEARFDLFRAGDLSLPSGRLPIGRPGLRLPQSPFRAKGNEFVFFTRVAPGGRRPGSAVESAWNSPVSLVPPSTANGGWTLRNQLGGDLSNERFVLFSPVPAL